MTDFAPSLQSFWARGARPRIQGPQTPVFDDSWILGSAFGGPRMTEGVST